MRARHSASNLAKQGSDAARVAAAVGTVPGALAVVAPGMTLEQVIREAQVGVGHCGLSKRRHASRNRCGKTAGSRNEGSGGLKCM